MDYEAWKKPLDPRAAMWEIEYDYPGRQAQLTLATSDRVESCVRDLARQLRVTGGFILSVRPLDGKDALGEES